MDPGDRGSSTPLTLLLGVSMLVLPVLVLVLTLPTWEQRAVDAEDAARNAARVLALAGTWGEGVAAADEAVAFDAVNDGLPLADLATAYSGSLGPGGEVTATVTVALPLGYIPGLGAVATAHFTASSTEHVDSYRGSPT